jgi:pilus assembly protein Flp/PilA
VFLRAVFSRSLLTVSSVKAHKATINPRERVSAKLISATIVIMNLKREEGQDSVEYALLVALIAFACTSGVGHLATRINSAFSKLAGAMTQV